MSSKIRSLLYLSLSECSAPHWMSGIVDAVQYHLCFTFSYTYALSSLRILSSLPLYSASPTICDFLSNSWSR